MSKFNLAWCSDLHLNFNDQCAHFVESLGKMKADALVITGDIATCRSIRQSLTTLSAVGIPIYFVTGNHDFYGGSFLRTDTEITAACRANDCLTRLGFGEIITLSPGLVLLGHGGWGDGRAGLGENTTIEMNDSLLIKDLQLTGGELFKKLKSLGEQSAQYMRSVMPGAVSQADQVIIATHVPPFAEAVRYEGKSSEAEYLPHYTNMALGIELLKIAKGWPKKMFTVICGHTHEACEYWAAENLLIRVAGATYRYPRVEAILEL